jgi:DNA-binding transcriptional ArsR family regulator
MDYDKTVGLLKALADKSRLQILDCVKAGVTNPGEISKKLDRHRSTIEKHLRILLKARIVEKVPSLNRAGHLSVNYRIRENASGLIEKVEEVCTTF